MIRLRQPLAQMWIRLPTGILPDDISQVILQELNVKKLHWIDKNKKIIRTVEA